MACIGDVCIECNTCEVSTHLARYIAICTGCQGLIPLRSMCMQMLLNWIHEIQKRDASKCVRVFVRFIPLFVVNQYGCCSYANWKGSLILAHSHLHRHDSMSLLIVCVLLFFLCVTSNVWYCLLHLTHAYEWWFDCIQRHIEFFVLTRGGNEPNIFLVLWYPVGNSACILVTFLHMIFSHWSEWGCRSVEFSWIQIH